MTDIQHSSVPASNSPESATVSSKFRAGWWLGVIALGLMFALLRWNNFNAPLVRDEGEYTYAARLLIHGQLPYEQSFLQKPPMVAYTYALAALVAPDVFWFPRVIAGLFAGTATVLLGYVARREFGPGVAWPAMWLMTPLILLPGLDQFSANTEMFMLLPVMAAVATYVHSRHGKGGWPHWLAAGIFGALAILYKYTAVPFLAFVFAAWSWEEWRRGKNPRAMVANWFAMILGGAAAALFVLAPFLLRDGGKRLWECTVVFNRFYAMSPGFGVGGTKYMLGQFGRDWWILFLAPFFLLYQRERRAGFWLLVFLASWPGTAGSFFGHYYMVVMPFWALITAVALRAFCRWAAAKSTLPDWGVKGLVTSVLFFMIFLPDAGWVLRTPEEFATASLGHWGTLVQSPEMAARLAQLTSPGDPVYVAGSEPQILCYAHRFDCTRFDIAYPLMIPTPLAKACQAEAIRDLQQSMPKAVVFSRPFESWLKQPATPPEFLEFLPKFLAAHYEIVGGYIFDGTQNQWQEPLAPENFARCSLMLYKRKAA